MEVHMYTHQATDLAPMLGNLRPEASLVDPTFASVDEAAALGECEALGLLDSPWADEFDPTPEDNGVALAATREAVTA